MKTFTAKIFVIAVTTLKISLAWAAPGGGSIIGNGAGLVENNFQIAYSNLGSVIEDCLVQRKCELMPTDLVLAKEMKSVFELNRNRKDRLVFSSAKENPGFFDTGDNEKHRIAKTFLDPNSPIFINTDLLYKEDGTPALDLNQAFAILVHELGHQAGETNHSYLDILGIKLKKAFSQKAHVYTLLVSPEKFRVEVTLINKTLPFAVTDISISWTTSSARLVTKELIGSVSCSSKTAQPTSYESFNGYFLESYNKGNDGIRSQFAFWLNLNCFDSATSKMSNEVYLVRFDFGQELKPKILEVKRLEQ